MDEFLALLPACGGGNYATLPRRYRAIGVGGPLGTYGSQLAAQFGNVILPDYCEGISGRKAQRHQTYQAYISYLHLFSP
jgi:hypothetical protein